jgi:hypothetical protein
MNYSPSEENRNIRKDVRCESDEQLSLPPDGRKAVVWVLVCMIITIHIMLYLSGCTFDRLRLDVNKGAFVLPTNAQPSVLEVLP